MRLLPVSTTQLAAGAPLLAGVQVVEAQSLITLSEQESVPLVQVIVYAAGGQTVGLIGYSDLVWPSLSVPPPCWAVRPVQGLPVTAQFLKAYEPESAPSVQVRVWLEQEAGQATVAAWLAVTEAPLLTVSGAASVQFMVHFLTQVEYWQSFESPVEQESRPVPLPQVRVCCVQVKSVLLV
jgi:hypothetical protein